MYASATVSVAGGAAAAAGCAAAGAALQRGGWATPTLALALSGVALSAYAWLLPAASAPGRALAAGALRGCADALAGVALPQLHAQAFGRREGGAVFAANRACGVVASGLGPLLYGVARDNGASFGPVLRATAPLPLLTAVVAVVAKRCADADAAAAAGRHHATPSGGAGREMEALLAPVEVAQPGERG